MLINNKIQTQAHISSTNIFNEDGRQDEKKAKRMEKIEERMMRDNKEIEETEKWKQKATQLEEENKRLRNLLSSVGFLKGGHNIRYYVGWEPTEWKPTIFLRS